MAADQINEFMRNSILSSDDEEEQDNRRFPIDSNNKDEWSSSAHELSHHHEEPHSLKDLDWNELNDFIRNMDQDYLDQREHRQIRDEKRCLLSFRRQLTDNNMTLRAAYKGTGFHLCPAKEFQQKASDFMLRTGVYSLIQELNGTNENMSQECLAAIVARVETTLDGLLLSKSITEAQYVKMNIDRSVVRLNYLYFVPETHKVCLSSYHRCQCFSCINVQQETIPVQPIMVCNDGPTKGISNYLGRLLGLVFDEATHCTTFSKGVDVLHTLNSYAQCGHLHPTTLFASFNIDELCTVFSHEQTIKALERFLHFDALDHLIDGMTNDTIIRLVRLVLENQYFVYNNNLYRQTDGGASGSLLTIPLVYIYLFYWQHDLMNAFVNTNELFGRYRDEAFITWNGSEHQLHTVLDTAKTLFPQDIWINTGIGIRTHYLDLAFGHNNGVLHTSVYHEPDFLDNNIFPLPNVTERPMYDKSKWLRAAFLRQARYCSDNVSYWNESRHIKNSFRENGFPKDSYIQVQNQFSDDFGIVLMRQIRHPSATEFIRKQVFRYDQFMAALENQPQAQQQVASHASYTPYSNEPKLAYHEKERNNYLNEHFEEWLGVEYIWFDIFPSAGSLLSANDLLVNKRPSIRLLTLSEKQKHKKPDNY